MPDWRKSNEYVGAEQQNKETGLNAVHVSENLEIRQVLTRNGWDDPWIEISDVANSVNAAPSNGDGGNPPGEVPSAHGNCARGKEVIFNQNDVDDDWSENPNSHHNRATQKGIRFDEAVLNREEVDDYWAESASAHHNDDKRNRGEKATVNMPKNLEIRQVLCRDCGDYSWIESSNVASNVNAAPNNGDGGNPRGEVPSAHPNCARGKEVIFNQNDVDDYWSENPNCHHNRPREKGIRFDEVVINRDEVGKYRAESDSAHHNVARPKANFGEKTPKNLEIRQVFPRTYGAYSWKESRDVTGNVHVAHSNGDGGNPRGEVPKGRTNHARGNVAIFHQDGVEDYWSENPNCHHNRPREKGIRGDKAAANRDEVDEYWAESANAHYNGAVHKPNSGEKSTTHVFTNWEIRQALPRTCGVYSWKESTDFTGNVNVLPDNGDCGDFRGEVPNAHQNCARGKKVDFWNENPNSHHNRAREKSIHGDKAVTNRDEVEEYWAKSANAQYNGGRPKANRGYKATETLEIRQVLPRSCGVYSWKETSDATGKVNEAPSNGDGGNPRGEFPNAPPNCARGKEVIFNEDNVEDYWNENPNSHHNRAREKGIRGDEAVTNPDEVEDYWAESANAHHNVARPKANRGEKAAGEVRQDLYRNCGETNCPTDNYCDVHANGRQNCGDEAINDGDNYEDYSSENNNGARGEGNRGEEGIGIQKANEVSSNWADRPNSGENHIQTEAHIRDHDYATRKEHSSPNCALGNGVHNKSIGEICPGRDRRQGYASNWGEHDNAGSSGSQNFAQRDNNPASNDRNTNNNGGYYHSRGDGQQFRSCESDINGNYGRKYHRTDDGVQREFYIPPVPTEDENEIFKTGIISGINFAKFDGIPVERSGENVPHQITTFAEAGLQEKLLENITKSGYTVPTPIQKAAIPVILTGRDLMACAQTGSGKTAAYLLPIIERMLRLQSRRKIGRPAAVILSPTRELSIQIYNEVRKFSHGTFIKSCLIYGGTTFVHQNSTLSQGCHILIATPGRLIDFVDRGAITFEEMRFFVLDEADRMLDMGFKPAINQVLNHITLRPRGARQTLMFSATFPNQIQRMAGEYLHDYVFIAVGIIGGANSDVLQLIHEVKKRDKLVQLRRLLIESDERTLVFVQTKRNVDCLASILYDSDHTVACIHGNRLQRQREEALDDFKSGRVKVLLATAVAARGLDINDVRHVVNYDLPKDINEYVHRIGRTGRLGNYGKATSFFDPDVDIPLVDDLIRVLEGAGQDVPSFLRYYASSGPSFYEDSGFGAVDVRGSTVIHELTEMWD